jgi:hypothetical protein
VFVFKNIAKFRDLMITCTSNRQKQVCKCCVRRSRKDFCQNIAHFTQQIENNQLTP